MKTRQISLLGLLRYQLREKLALYRDGSKRIDIAGSLLSAALAVAFMWVFVYILGGFADMYLDIQVNYVTDITARMTELLTIGYAVVFVVCVVSGINTTNRELFNNSSMTLYVAMPVSKFTLYISKLVWAYLGQLAACAVIVLPFNITLGVMTGMGTSYYIMTALFCFVLPLMAMSVASILALPVHYISKKLGQYYVLILVVSVVLMVGAFVVYMQLLELLQQMLVTGEIRLLFTAQFMYNIGNVVSSMIPVVWLANITLGSATAANISFVCGFAIVSVSVSLLLCRVTFGMALRSSQLEQTNTMLRMHRLPPSSPMGALVRKEFMSVLRTPSYAMQYFGVAIILPLLVYMSLTMGNTLVYQLVYIDCSFELALTLTILYCSLTNTFCATNISREGDMIHCIKAMPLSATAVVNSKVLFCMIVASLSQLANSIVLIATGSLGVLEALFVLVAGLLLALAQICMATRLDINHPNVSHEGDVITDSNSVVSTVVLVGLASSLVLGGSAMYFSIVQNLLYNAGLIASVVSSTLFTTLVVGVIAVLLAVCGIVFLRKGLVAKLNAIGGNTK